MSGGVEAYNFNLQTGAIGEAHLYVYYDSGNIVFGWLCFKPYYQWKWAGSDCWQHVCQLMTCLVDSGGGDLVTIVVVVWCFGVGVCYSSLNSCPGCALWPMTLQPCLVWLFKARESLVAGLHEGRTAAARREKPSNPEAGRRVYGVGCVRLPLFSRPTITIQAPEQSSLLEMQWAQEAGGNSHHSLKSQAWP